MKIKFMPESKLGKWSLWLFISLIVIFILVQIIVISGQRGGNTFFDNLYISIPMLIVAILGVLCFFTGIIAIINKKERSILVYIPTLIGLLMIFFIIGEILVPH